MSAAVRRLLLRGARSAVAPSLNRLTAVPALAAAHQQHQHCRYDYSYRPTGRIGLLGAAAAFAAVGTAECAGSELDVLPADSARAALEQQQLSGGMEDAEQPSTPQQPADAWWDRTSWRAEDAVGDPRKERFQAAIRAVSSATTDVAVLPSAATYDAYAEKYWVSTRALLLA